MACMHTCTATTRVRSAHRPAVRHGGGTPTKNGHTACTGHAHRFTHRLRPSAYPAIGAPPCLEVGPALQPPRRSKSTGDRICLHGQSTRSCGQVQFSFFFPCTGTTPSLQEGPPITSSGTSRTRTRRATCAQDRPPEDQVPPGRQRGRWRRQKLLRMCQGWAHRIPKHGSDGHPSMAASRSMAVTGTQSRRPGQGQGGLLERRRCCR